MGFWRGADSDNPLILTAKLSPEYNADQIIFTGECVFYGIIIKTDGTNDITFTVWDALSATGTQLTPDNCVIAGAKNIDSIGYPIAIKCDTGIFVEVSGAGAEAFQVLYDDGA